MLKGLIFDFDGLIVDTETVIYETWADIYKQNGQILELDDYKQCVGSDFAQFDPGKELERKCGKTFDWNALNQEREVTIREKLKTQKERPGIISFLDEAKKIGLKTAIASSSSKAWVVGWVERLQIKHYFEKFLNRDDVKRIKPAPDLFLASCKALEINTTEALVLEDSENGLKAATAAGIQCAIVTNEITEGGSFSDSVLQTDNFSDNRLKKLLFDL